MPGAQSGLRPEMPGNTPVEETGAGTPTPDASTTPLLAHTPEPEPVLPLTPVPVLPLSILYGVILLCAGGYFWYTARLAEGENEGVGRLSR